MGRTQHDLERKPFMGAAERTWRQHNAERERDPVRNCKRCEHYLTNGKDCPPVCVKWSRLRGHVVFISLGSISGEYNDAPFCQFFEVKR